MSLFTLLVVLCVIGLMAWIAVTLIPMPEGIKRLIVIVAVVCAVIYVLNAFGFHLPSPSVPRLR